MNLCNKSKTIESKSNADPKHTNENYLLSKKVPVKAVSYDDIVHVSNEPPASKRSNFPYAFLRSKLSVLPEENGGSVINQKRILQEIQLLEHSMANANVGHKAEPACNGKTAQHHQPHDEIVSNGAIELTTSNENGNSEQHPQSQRTPYQRFSSCFSSNESGYDSDSRHTDEQNPVVKSPTDLAYTPYFGRRKRCKYVKLQRRRSNDLVGIEVAAVDSPNGGRRKYIVANMLDAGLAHTDGQIAIGDEIINVNCTDLQEMQTNAQADELVSTFVDDVVELVIAHDEPTTWCNESKHATADGKNAFVDFLSHFPKQCFRSNEDPIS